VQEGWLGDDYFVLFSPEERHLATREYKVGDFLPGYAVVGLVGWDDLLLQDPSGVTCRLPAVPLDAEYLHPFSLPAVSDLQPDPRFTGKIKWYTTPVVFGGNPSDHGNMVWVTHNQHRQVVGWWNEKYREVKAAQSGKA
jgi:hypothetical protein